MDTLLIFLAGTMDTPKLSLDDLGSVPEHSDCRGICVEGEIPRYDVPRLIRGKRLSIVVGHISQNQNSLNLRVLYI